MNLDFDRAVSVFRKVKQVQEEIQAYCLSPDRPDLPVEDFQRIIAQMYGITIEKYQVAFEGVFLRGVLERYGDRAVIYIKKNMEEDWKRFASVKEMCHLMNDQEEDWSPKGHRTIQDLLAEHKISSDATASNVVQSETFAEIAAIELLYPHQTRVNDQKQLSGGAVTLAQIANHHKVPEVIIEKSLQEWYCAIANRLWEAVTE